MPKKLAGNERLEVEADCQRIYRSRRQKDIDGLLDVRERLISWCEKQREDIGLELQAMGQNIKNFPFNLHDDIAAWNNEIKINEQNLSEFESSKRHLLSYAFEENVSVDRALGEGSLSEVISHLEKVEWLLRIVGKLCNDRASLDWAKSELAKVAVQAKLAADPKQAAKVFVKDCWQTWQEEPERYKSKAAFARDMLKQDQCKSLESQVKITDWCRQWEKSHPAG